MPILVCCILQLPTFHDVSVVTPTKYPFDSMPLREWTYNNPWHTLGYCCNYCFGKWTTYLEGGLPPFHLLDPMTSGYSYHQKWLPNFDGQCYYWPDLHKYGAMNIYDNNTCIDNGYSKKDTILCWMSTKQWLHSPCYRNVWVFSFSFWFILDHLCTNHYHTSSAIFFTPFDAYFSLSTTCVHSSTTCENHNDFSMGYCTWSRFFISSMHHN
jgi:hypothetical protein